MSRLLLFLLITLSCSLQSSYCQNVPDAPNVKDANGLRQGLWKDPITRRRLATQEKDSIFYYRLARFEDDKPVDTVREYFPTGVLFWKGFLTKIGWRIKQHGICSKYRPDGTLQFLNEYKNNELIESIEFKEDGKTPDNSFRGFYLEAVKRSKEYDEKEAFRLAGIAEKRMVDAGQSKSSTFIYNSLFEKETLEKLTYWETVIDEEAGKVIHSRAGIGLFPGLEKENKKKIEDYLKQALASIDPSAKNMEKEKLAVYTECFQSWSYKSPDSGRKYFQLVESYYIRNHPRESRIFLDFISSNLDEIKKYRSKLEYDSTLDFLERNLHKFYKENEYDLFWKFNSLIDRYLKSVNRKKAKELLLLEKKIFASWRPRNGVDSSFYKNCKIHIIEGGILNYSLMFNDVGILENLPISQKTGFEESKEKHPFRLSPIYFQNGQWSNLFKSFKNHFEKENKTWKYGLKFMTDEEKLRFYSWGNDSKAEFNSYASVGYKYLPAFTDEMFNLNLAHKTFIVSSSAKWKHRIKTSGDRKLFAQFSKWEENQAILSGLLKKKVESVYKDSLQLANNVLERELTRKSEAFAALSDNQTYTWKDVQKKLKPGEAALEIIRIQKFGQTKVLVDSTDMKRYPQYGLTDTAQYVGLLVKPTSKNPELILLEKGNFLEDKAYPYYQNMIQKTDPDLESYDRFWRPFAQKLKGVSRLYFSADGIYNKVNLNTLYDPKTKTYLLDQLNLIQVTSTKDLLTHSKPEPENKLVYLYGFPDYSFSDTLQSKKTESLLSTKYVLNRGNAHQAVELPGTKTEVNLISGLLKKSGWNPVVLTGEEASEESIKSCFKPRVLHIASHGYFDSDKTEQENPMLRSGLLLAGANQTKPSEKSEDGILTAFEAMNLNLDNTDLVVLSACETGLGDIQNGEGVYGLQRAIHVAGAKSLIMSLWKVDDDATQELMVSFYKNWLGSVSDKSQSAGGLNKRSAFLKAQKELKAKYPNPYYWGAFVMVGE